ncbi:MAG: glycosyltransferase [Thermoleophilaceae bacterium]|nr:glycosyltransferase [Thermoleophilaceae bacterium]
MRFVYFAPADIDLPRVDRQCIVSFCAALARSGVDLELVGLRIKTMPEEPQAEHPLSLYPIEVRFPTRLVRVPVTQTSPGWWVAVNRLVVHSVYAFAEVMRGRRQPLCLFTKTYSTALALLLGRRIARRPPVVVFEAHVPPRNAVQRWVLRHVDRVVANTHALAGELADAWDIPSERILGTHQGVDLELIDSQRLTRSEARSRLGISEERSLVVYTGKIYEGYGEVEYLLEVAQRALGDERFLFLLVGGRHDHVARLRDRCARDGLANVVMTGFVPPTEVPAYQFAADVLVLYYPSGLALNAYRSPGKLFEYMASGRPIVSVDLPVLREVLTDECASFVEADSPEALWSAIQELVDAPERAERMGSAALERVRDFTWDRRATRIMNFVSAARDWEMACEPAPNQR